MILLDDFKKVNTDNVKVFDKCRGVTFQSLRVTSDIYRRYSVDV